MDRLKSAIVALVSIFVSGCGSSWINLNGTAAVSDQIQAAKKKCEVDNKIYKLSYQETATDAAIQSISNETSKEELRKGFEMKERSVYLEIEACMETEGLKQK